MNRRRKGVWMGVLGGGGETRILTDGQIGANMDNLDVHMSMQVPNS